MILGIDAANIRVGGGLTHLVELLRAAEPRNFGFDSVVVWAGRRTLERIEPRDWLRLEHRPALDRSLPSRAWWQRTKLSDCARSARCDVLFVPGGSFSGDFRPVVSFHQNLLPFEWRELRRYGASMQMLKMLLLRLVQARTFRRSDGVIFLSEYARKAVERACGHIPGVVAIIAHGVDPRFSLAPRPQRPIGSYSPAEPFRFLYVSVVDVYKHQWNAAIAVEALQRDGYPVVLDLVGAAYPPALRTLRSTLDRIDPDAKCVRYLGKVPHAAVPDCYRGADVAIFASTCETFGQILTEAMAAGLPVASSDRSAMPEVLDGGGVYFDPEDPASIASALRKLMESPSQRAEIAQIAFARSKLYSWERCARETFTFLRDVARDHSRLR